jgi:L-lactate dehydrogenase complex protein LldG
MTSAREEILARIRTALGDTAVRDVEVPRDYRRTGRAGIDVLVDRLMDYKALVRCCRADEVPAVVAAALAERSARRVVVPADLDPLWTERVDVDVTRDDGNLLPADLDSVDGVITTCAVAIAETGTIVLDAGSGQGRRVLTLVPDYHLCVVPADRVVATVPEAVARLDPTRPLTWISGPSATSDIELSRVEGVHGPRTLEAVIVEA